MAEIASAFVTIAPSAKGFGSKLNSQVGGEVDSAGKSIGGKFGSALKVGALGVVGGAVLLGGFLKGAIGEAREAQKVGALTTNVIKQTGGAANVTAAQVGKLAGAISLKTGIDDEAIQSGANLLLTFKNVANEAGKGNDVFDRATKAAVDLSAAGFGALEGTSKQLGKALNDPIKGISALSRSGVTFTAQQQEQIKTLVASGDVLKAQKIILGEVESQVGGAAAASATYGEKASVAFGNIQEQVGTALLPVVDGFFKLFLGAVPTITALIDGIGPAFGRVGAFFAPFVAQVQGFFGGGSGGGILATLQTFGTTIAATLLPVLKTLATTFTTTILPAITTVATYVAGKLFPVFTQVAGIITGTVLPILGSLAQFFVGQVIPAVVAVYASVASKLKPVFDQLVATFRSQVLPTVQKLLSKFQEYQPMIQKIVLAFVKIIGKVAEFAATILGKVLPVVIRFAGYLISNVVPAVANVIGVVIKIIAKVVDFGGAVVDAVSDFAKFVTGLKEKFGNALEYIKSIPGKVTEKLGSLKSTLLSAGADLIQGFIDGISSKFGAVKDKLGDLTGKLTGWKGPPSTDKVLLRNNGRLVIGGFVDGINDGEAGLRKTLGDITEKVGKITRDSLVKSFDKMKERLSALKSDFKSLSQSIAGAFTGDLFNAAATFDDAGNLTATASQNFLASLTAKKGELTSLLASFKTLQGWGIPASFLSQLFASGNGALITELAGLGQAGATSAATLFGDVTSLGNQLGNAVATNDYGKNIDRVGDKIEELRKDIKNAPKETGKETAKALVGTRLVLEGGNAGQRAYLRTGK